MEMLIILILMGSIIGGICAGIASSKGRSTGGWFAGGFAVGFLTGILGGWIPIVIVACLSNLKEEQSHRDFQARENRRLREQLRQERLKNEAFRQHTFARLDAHDHQLGVDTKQTYTALPGHQADQPHLLEATSDLDQLAQAHRDGDVIDVNNDFEQPVAQQVVQHAQHHAPQIEKPLVRQWHYESHGQAVGPIPETQLLAMLRAGQLTGSTLVWTEEIHDWRAANQIGALRPYVKA